MTHRDQRVAQPVLGDDDRLGQALGARGADEVLLQDVDERRAREARHDRRDGRAQRERRQDVVPPGVGADRRQPVELHGEDLHQHHAERERGKRDAGHRERHAQPVGPAVAPDGRQRCRSPMPNDDRPRHRPDREPERRREAVGDLRRHRALGAHRLAEVAGDGAGDEADELLRAAGGRGRGPCGRAATVSGVASGPAARRAGSPGSRCTQQEDQQPTMSSVGTRPEQALDDVLEHARRGRCGPLTPFRGSAGSTERAFGGCVPSPARGESRGEARELLQVDLGEVERSVRDHVDARELLVVRRQQRSVTSGAHGASFQIVSCASL